MEPDSGREQAVDGDVVVSSASSNVWVSLENTHWNGLGTKLAAKEVSDYFYIMERGSIVKNGAISELSDEIIATYLSV